MGSNRPYPECEGGEPSPLLRLAPAFTSLPLPSSVVPSRGLSRWRSADAGRALDGRLAHHGWKGGRALSEWTRGQKLTRNRRGVHRSGRRVTVAACVH